MVETKIADWFYFFSNQYVLFEVTDFCNLNCVMCSHDYPKGPHKIKKGFMSVELFKNILFQFPKKKVSWAIKLFWLGEPLLHPNINEIIEITSDYIETVDNKAFIDIHTNAIFLDKATDIIIKTGVNLPVITFSIDAINNETYLNIRRGAKNINIVNENILNFLINRRSEFPKVIIQFILMEENKEEVFDFIDYWSLILKKYGTEHDTIYIKRQDLHFEEKQEKYNKVYLNFAKQANNIRNNYLKIDIIENFVSKDSTPVCCAPWKTPIINYNGDLTVCCFDSFFDYKLGSLRKKSFKSLWFSEKISNMRSNLLDCNYDKIFSLKGKNRCSGCIHIPWPKFDEKELKILRNEI